MIYFFASLVLVLKKGMTPGLDGFQRKEANFTFGNKF